MENTTEERPQHSPLPVIDCPVCEGCGSVAENDPDIALLAAVKVLAETTKATLQILAEYADDAALQIQAAALRKALAPFSKQEDGNKFATTKLTGK